MSEIIKYNTEVSKEPLEFFIDLMQGLDDAFLTAYRAKSEKKKASTQAANKSNPQIKARI